MPIYRGSGNTVVADIYPDYANSTWVTTTNNSANWDTAFGWGNHANGGYVIASNNLSDLPNPATARSNLGLVIGTDVEAYDATILKSADIGVTVEAYDATILKSADIGVSVQAYDATIVVDADIGVTVQGYDVDTAKIDVNQTWTASQRGSTQTASVTGATTLNFDTYQHFVLTLTGNVTLDNPTTEGLGQSGFIVFIQDGTGSRTVSLGTDYETVGGLGLTLSTAASSRDVVPYIVSATGSILLGVPQKGFA